MATMFKTDDGREVNIQWVEGMFKIGTQTFNNLTEVNEYLDGLAATVQYKYRD